MGWLDWLGGKRRPGAPQLDPMMQALAAGGDTAARGTFYQALLRAQLLVPSPGLEASGLPVKREAVIERETKLNLLGMEAPDGSRGLIVLTSQEALLAWRPVGCPYVALAARDVFAMALQSGFGSVVINPGGPSGGLIPLGELRALAEGRLPGRSVERLQVGNGTSIVLSRPPRPVPPELLEVVRGHAEARPEVRAAWVLQMAMGDETPHLCVILEHAEGARPDEFVPRLMTAVQAVLPDGECVDCLPQPSSGSILATAREVSPPVFRRA